MSWRWVWMGFLGICLFLTAAGCDKDGASPKRPLLRGGTASPNGNIVSLKYAYKEEPGKPPCVATVTAEGTEADAMRDLCRQLQDNKRHNDCAEGERRRAFTEEHRCEARNIQWSGGAVDEMPSGESGSEQAEDRNPLDTMKSKYALMFPMKTATKPSGSLPDPADDAPVTALVNKLNQCGLSLLGIACGDDRHNNPNFRIEGPSGQQLFAFEFSFANQDWSVTVPVSPSTDGSVKAEFRTASSPPAGRAAVVEMTIETSVTKAMARALRTTELLARVLAAMDEMDQQNIDVSTFRNALGRAARLEGESLVNLIAKETNGKFLFPVGRFFLLEEPTMETKKKQQIAEQLLKNNDLKIRQLGAIGLLPFNPGEIATLNLAIQSLTTQSQDPVVTRGALAGLLPIAKRLTDSERVADVLRGLALLDDQSRALAVKLVGDLSLTANHIHVLVSTFQGITDISSSASNSAFRAAKLLLVDKIKSIDKTSLSRVREIEKNRPAEDQDHEILRALGKP